MASVGRKFAPFPIRCSVVGARQTFRELSQRVRRGESPEQIAEIFPALTLAQVHAALSYYHERPTEIETYIRKNEAALWQTRSPKNQI